MRKLTLIALVGLLFSSSAFGWWGTKEKYIWSDNGIAFCSSYSPAVQVTKAFDDGNQWKAGSIILKQCRKLSFGLDMKVLSESYKGRKYTVFSVKLPNGTQGYFIGFPESVRSK
jgi:hypothetical protein